MCVANRCIHLCCKYLYDVERGRGSTDTRFDKVLSIRDGKVDPLLHRSTWDCHLLHEAPLVFRRSIAAQIRSWQLTFIDDITLLIRSRILEILNYIHKYI